MRWGALCHSPVAIFHGRVSLTLTRWAPAHSAVLHGAHWVRVGSAEATEPDALHTAPLAAAYHDVVVGTAPSEGIARAVELAGKVSADAWVQSRARPVPSSVIPLVPEPTRRARARAALSR